MWAGRHWRRFGFMPPLGPASSGILWSVCIARLASSTKADDFAPPGLAAAGAGEATGAGLKPMPFHAPTSPLRHAFLSDSETAWTGVMAALLMAPPAAVATPCAAPTAWPTRPAPLIAAVA